MNSHLVAIIILNWNGYQDTVELIESLQKLTDKNFVTIIVDNASCGDDATLLKERFGDLVNIIQNAENFGFAEGNNIGIRFALSKFKPEFVWLLNNDTVVTPKTLQELRKTAIENPYASIIGNQILYWNTSNLYCIGGGKLNSWTGIDRLYGAGQKISNQHFPIKLSYISGTSMFIHSNLFSLIGYFDKDYFLYNEEVDLCTRALRNNLLFAYSSKAIIYHKTSKSSGYQSPLYIYYFLRNKLIYLKKNGYWWQYPTYLSTFIFYYCLGFLVLGMIHQHKNNLPFIWQACIDFIRKRWSYQMVKS